MTDGPSVRIVLATRSAIYARGLVDCLRSDPRLQCVERAGSAAGLLDDIARLVPDVVILETLLARADFAVLCQQVRASRPGVKILALGDSALDPLPLIPLRAGVNGYLLGSCEAAELIRAIHAVLRGDLYITPSVAAALVQRVHTLERRATSDDANGALTRREVQVLELLATGKSHREIAGALTLSERTVENHVQRVYRKFGVHDRAQAILVGLRRGYLPMVLVRTEVASTS